MNKQSRSRNTVQNIALNFETASKEKNRIYDTTIARGEIQLEFLDYTFRNSKAQIKSTKKTDKRQSHSSLQSHISDLENTFALNCDYIIQLIPILQHLKQPQKRKFLEKMRKIMDLQEMKKTLRNTLNNLNGKILINKQIMTEQKRGNEEKSVYWKDQIFELTENVNKKTSLVKQFQKKFSEVEIYIQRECINPVNIRKWGHWNRFTIVPFIVKNEALLKRKSYYDLIIEKKGEKAINLINENKFLKMPVEPIRKNKEKGYDDILNSLQNKILFLERMKEKYHILAEDISEGNLKKEAIPSFVPINAENYKFDSPLKLNSGKNDNTEENEKESMELSKQKGDILTVNPEEDWNISIID